MQRAGVGAAQQIWRIDDGSPFLALCGPGNNGGDGYVIAQWLLEKGADITVARSAAPTTDAAAYAASQWQGKTVLIEDADPAPQFIDCLFGTGLTRPIDGILSKYLSRLSSKAHRRYAVDFPSGVHSDTGVCLNHVDPFDLTIALGAYKPSHFLMPARDIMGQLTAVPIGIDTPSKVQIIARPNIAPPKPDSHKYSRGLVAVIAREMHGAARLAALAAQQTGAGYTKILGERRLASPNHSIVVGEREKSGDLAAQLEDQRISSVVIGPGLGRSEQSRELLEMALASGKPLVLDADALVLLGIDCGKRIAKHDAPVIVTPHQGEFESIYNGNGGSKIELAQAFAKNSNATVLYKGADTVIAAPDGRAAVDAMTSSWLSTAGSGDVLAGMIASRFAALGDMFHAASEAQWLHSRAAQLSGPAFSPEKLIEHIAPALQECL